MLKQILVHDSKQPRKFLTGFSGNEECCYVLDEISNRMVRYKIGTDSVHKYSHAMEARDKTWYDLAINANGDSIVASNILGEIHAFSYDGDAVTHALHPSGVHVVCISHDLRKAAVWYLTHRGELCFWDYLSNEKRLGSPSFLDGGISSGAFSPEMDCVYFITRDKMLMSKSIPGDRNRNGPTMKENFGHLSIASKNGKILFRERGGAVQIVDPNSMDLTTSLTVEPDVYDIAMPSGNLIIEAIGTVSKKKLKTDISRIRLCTLPGREVLQEIRLRGSLPPQLILSRKGRYIAASTELGVWVFELNDLP